MITPQSTYTRLSSKAARYNSKFPNPLYKCRAPKTDAKHTKHVVIVGPAESVSSKPQRGADLLLPSTAARPTFHGPIPHRLSEQRYSILRVGGRIESAK